MYLAKTKENVYLIIGNYKRYNKNNNKKSYSWREKGGQGNKSTSLYFDDASVLPPILGIISKN